MFYNHTSQIADVALAIMSSIDTFCIPLPHLPDRKLHIRIGKDRWIGNLVEREGGRERGRQTERMWSGKKQLYYCDWLHPHTGIHTGSVVGLAMPRY